MSEVSNINPDFDEKSEPSDSPQTRPELLAANGDETSLVLGYSEEITPTPSGVSPTIDQAEAQHMTSSRLKKVMHVAKRVGESAIIALEVNPLTNEGIRYGSAVATFAATKNPWLTAGVLGGSTTLLEGSAAAATADILTSSTESKPISLLRQALNHRKVRQYVINENGRLSTSAEALLALYAGTSILLTAKEGEIDAATRTKLERTKYGVKIAAWLGVVCAAEGFLGAEGILDYRDPKVSVPVAAGVIGLVSVFKRLKSRIRRKKELEESTPRYDLSAEEISVLEKDLVEDVDKQTKKLFRKRKPGIYAVWMSSSNKYANILRTNEAAYFPEVKDLTGEVEDDTTFLAMVDTRPESRRVVHATTVSGIDRGAEVLNGEEKTGFITIDELVGLKNFTVKEFEDYYKQRNIDLSKSISVDTNFRIGKKALKAKGLTAADLAYLTTFQVVQRQKPDEVNTTNAVFASVNRASLLSFNRIGLEFEPLMGRKDLITPESEEGRESLPVAIPLNAHNDALFKAMNYEVPELTLT